MAMNKGDLETLEKFQNRSIRHITKSPAHIDHVTNSDIRRDNDVPTITSMLRKHRLTFLKDVCQHPNENQQLIATMHGTCEWDTTIPSSSNNAIVKQLNDDIHALWKGVHKNGLFFNSPPPSEWSAEYINTHMQKWLTDRSPNQIKTVLTHVDEREETKKNRRGCTLSTEQTEHKCQTCGVFFTNACSLAVHRVKKHGEQNRARTQVSDNTCPGCDKVFSNRVNAQRHWQQQICTHNQTAKRTIEQVATMQRNHEIQTESSGSNGISYNIMTYFQTAAMQ